MKNKIECVLLIDDDKVTNFYNKKVLTKHEEFKEIIAVTSGENALKHLTEASKGLCLKPNLIFLDINMPAMNGWEFILEYNKLDKKFTKDIKLVMLTTSNNPDDYKRSKEIETVNDFINKPLSIDLLSNLIENHYEKKITY
ncbi:response regulator [uncultured Lacinutrix sp.]|uniref:response regulator n=1 Tax=uncultured Lacinutrix sp. TaxID=574032 RepID=UPI002625D129|nr:response regulator [uncultured Lacinutrix sp.]